MKTTDLFTTSSKKLNESLHKTFGKKINLETFSLDQLQDARNKLRTQLSQVRSESGFNENLEDDAFHQAQWMLDAINAEIAERDEHIIESDVEEGQSDVDYELHQIAKSDDEEELIDAMEGLKGAEVQIALEDMMSELKDELAAKGMNDVMRDEDKMIEMLMDKLFDEYGEDGEEYDDGGETDDNYALASAGFGSDEDYESINNEELDGKYKDVDQDTGDRVIEWLEDWEGYLNDTDDFGLASDVNELSEKFYQGEIGFKAVEKFVLDIAENPDSPLRQDWEENFPPNKVKITQPDMFDDMQTEKAPGYVSRGVGSLTGAVSGIGGALLGSMFWGLLGPVGVAAGAIGGTVGGYKVGSETADAVWDKVTELLGSDKKATEFGVAHAKAAKAGETSFEFGGKEYDVTLKPQEVGKAVADLKAVKEAYTMEVSPPGFKGTVKAMKKHDEIDNPYALAWHMKKKGYKSHKKADGSDKNESVTQGEDMTTLREGEVQQASAIVTAKTMVDRVGRWIEELSGMENETLLQLGDSIRDEMGQEQAKAFIEACAPAIQQALETLKGTRDTLSNGVRSLASGEQPADMLGAEPAAAGGEEEMGMTEPDAMNMPAEEPMGDEFGAAEPATGGAETAGREQRESIEYQNRLLKVLAG